MGIAILFRKNLEGTSPFYRELNKLVSSSGEGLILSSGYTGAQDFDLRNNINLGFQGYNNSQLITLSGNFGSRCTCKSNNSKCHYDRYIDFVHYMNRGCHCNQKRFLIDTYGNWHAKISMKTRDNVPFAMIVGSSNLSNSALGLNGSGKHESDVLIWRDDYFPNPNFLEGLDKHEYWRLSPYYQGQEADLLNRQHIDLLEYINNYNKVQNVLL
ncbi:hypothetical protein [Solibacillus isronensis]|uniref:hypothetical protein n=1 Tax=Solibacillus isronensis TaxID=412383 RepID=UPI0009A5F708|nr:hypothetical protein [Solibacillus isronensis]